MLKSVIGSLVLGLIIGALGKLIMPGRDSMGCLATALLGVGGSIVGGLIGSALWPALGQEGFASSHRLLHFSFAVIGAVILLWLWRAVSGRR